MALRPGDLESVHYYLTNNRVPDTVAKTSGKKANFERLASKFTLINGKLHTCRSGKRGPGTSDPGEGKKLRVIIDIEERQRILRSVHEGGGVNFAPPKKLKHFGQDKTEIRLLEECWWPGIRKDVRHFVNSCKYCQCSKPDRKSQQALLPPEKEASPEPLPTQPWERIGIEICHMPLSREGFSFLAVVVDYFSVWIEAEPLAAKTPDSVANFLHRLFCRHGCADIQVVDMDKEFTQQVSDHLHCLVGARQSVTNVCHSRASELFDTYSHMVHELLMKLLNSPSDVADWPKALPGILFTFRTKAMPSSSFSPYYLLYGRSPKLPAHSGSETTFSDGSGFRGKIVGGTGTVAIRDGSGDADDDLMLTAEEGEDVITEKGRGTLASMEDSVSDNDFGDLTVPVKDEEPAVENCGPSKKTKVGKHGLDGNMDGYAHSSWMENRESVIAVNSGIMKTEPKVWARSDVSAKDCEDVGTPAELADSDMSLTMNSSSTERDSESLG